MFSQKKSVILSVVLAILAFWRNVTTHVKNTVIEKDDTKSVFNQQCKI